MAGNVADMNTNLELNEATSDKGQIVGYARVSSSSQNLARQIAALESYGCVKIFQEQVSGANRDRDELKNAFQYLREGDEFVCLSMDRLARSLGDLHQIVADLTSKGIKVTFLKESQSYGTTNDPIACLMLGLLGSVSEFERALIKERQAEGIARAKVRGVYKGRAKSLTMEQENQIRERVAAGVPKAQVAREMGVSRATLYRYLSSRRSESSSKETQSSKP